MDACSIEILTEKVGMKDIPRRLGAASLDLRSRDFDFLNALLQFVAFVGVPPLI